MAIKQADLLESYIDDPSQPMPQHLRVAIARAATEEIKGLREAHREIVTMEVPVGAGAECADWFKAVSRRALNSGAGPDD